MSAEPNGPCYVWLDDESGDVFTLGEQSFPGVPASARTLLVVETRAEAEVIRDALLRGEAPDVDIAGPSAYTPDAA